MASNAAKSAIEAKTIECPSTGPDAAFRKAVEDHIKSHTFKTVESLDGLQVLADTKLLIRDLYTKMWDNWWKSEKQSDNADTLAHLVNEIATQPNGLKMIEKAVENLNETERSLYRCMPKEVGKLMLNRSFEESKEEKDEVDRWNKAAGETRWQLDRFVHGFKGSNMILKTWAFENKELAELGKTDDGKRWSSITFERVRKPLDVKAENPVESATKTISEEQEVESQMTATERRQDLDARQEEMIQFQADADNDSRPHSTGGVSLYTHPENSKLYVSFILQIRSKPGTFCVEHPCGMTDGSLPITQFLNEAKEEAVIRVKAEDVIYRTQMTKDAGFTNATEAFFITKSSKPEWVPREMEDVSDHVVLTHRVGEIMQGMIPIRLPVEHLGSVLRTLSELGVQSAPGVQLLDAGMVLSSQLFGTPYEPSSKGFNFSPGNADETEPPHTVTE